VDPEVVAVVLDPLAQPWPLAEQRLVRELDGARADGQQPGVGEMADHGRGVAAALGLELREREAAALDAALGLHLGQPEEHRARERLLPRVEPAERLLREPRDRPEDAARGLVGREPQPPPVPALPELEQRRGQQRERAGLVLDVAHQRLDEVGLDVQADPLRRADDHLAQLHVPHRADQHMVRGEQAREVRICRAAPVEVGADRHDDDAALVALCDPHQLRHEAAALLLVAADGERLLELVHREDDAAARIEAGGRATQLARRVLAGPDQHLRPCFAAR
jgi:hypothetical protein